MPLARVLGPLPRVQRLIYFMYPGFHIMSVPKLSLVVKSNNFSFPLAAIAHFSCCMWYVMLHTCTLYVPVNWDKPRAWAGGHMRSADDRKMGHKSSLWKVTFPSIHLYRQILGGPRPSSTLCYQLPNQVLLSLWFPAGWQSSGMIVEACSE